MNNQSNNFTLTRTVDAPRDLVWDVFTQPEHLMHWWGPKGLEMSRCTVDLRPGGLFHYGMKTPDGNEMWGKFVYQEIDPKSRISFVVSFSDENGGVTRHPLSAAWPLEVMNVVTLTEENGKTTMTFTGKPINASEEEVAVYNANHASMQQGFKGTFDQLDEYLSTLKATAL